MKASDKKFPINTIPEGVWESSEPSNKTNLQQNTQSGLSIANISATSIDKISSLEKYLSEENNENIVLVAYRTD